MLHKITLDELSSMKQLDELLSYASKNCVSYIKIVKVDTHYDIEYNDVDTPNNKTNAYAMNVDLLEFKLAYLLGIMSDYYMFYDVSTNTYIVNKYGVMANNVTKKDKVLKAIEYLRNTQEILSDLHVSDLKSNLFTNVSNSKRYKNNTFNETLDFLYQSLSTSFAMIEE